MRTLLECIANIPDLESQINSNLKGIDRWLKANVSMSPISSRQKLQSLNDYTMIHVDIVPINQSNQSKSLGLIIENLSWKAHIHEISRKSILCYRCGSGHLFQCTPQLKFTKVLSSHTSIIAALYGMAWPNTLVRNFKNFKSVLSVTFKSSYDTSSRCLLNSLVWDRLSVRRAKQKANLMYKCINNLAPAYFCNLFAPRTPNYYFRNAKKKLMVPKPRTDYLKRSLRSMAVLSEARLSGEAAKTREDTRQICKTVFQSFKLIFYVRLMFLTVSFHWIRLPKPLFVKPFPRVV